MRARWGTIQQERRNFAAAAADGDESAGVAVEWQKAVNNTSHSLLEVRLAVVVVDGRRLRTDHGFGLECRRDRSEPRGDIR